MSDHHHEHDHAYMHAHGIAHDHGHVHENQKAVVNRLARAIGHLEKVKRMVEEGYDCSDVLVQLAAVRSALDNGLCAGFAKLIGNGAEAGNELDDGGERTHLAHAAHLGAEVFQIELVLLHLHIRLISD